MRPFKTETVEDLTIEQYNLLTELHIYEHERELAELERETRTRRTTGSSGGTVSIKNVDG